MVKQQIRHVGVHLSYEIFIKQVITWLMVCQFILMVQGKILKTHKMLPDRESTHLPI